MPSAGVITRSRCHGTEGGRGVGVEWGSGAGCGGAGGIGEMVGRVGSLGTDLTQPSASCPGPGPNQRALKLQHDPLKTVPPFFRGAEVHPHVPLRRSRF